MSSKRRGLGRGLDALLPRGTDAAGDGERSDAARAIRWMALTDLQPSPYQPRGPMDDVKVAELAASIAEKGVLQPLLVRPAEDRYEIVAGERRYRAATKAGLSSVPVVVRELSDQETLEIAIIENLQREDLTALEEARAYQRLLEFGLDQAGVAKAVGKSRSSVANTLRLLGLPVEAQRALDAGRISPGHARAILAIDEADRGWALQQIVERDLTVRQAEALRRTADRERRSAADGRYHHLEEELASQLGTRVRMRGGKKGRIELHFHSEEELERLLELLGYQA